MGFDIERFSEPVNDGLLCCICRDVLEDPVQSPCEHAFCRLCIEGWLVQENRCPEDRKPLSLSQLKPLYRYMRNDLHKLKIRCRNSHLGCTHVGELEHIENHEAECLHTTVSSCLQGKTFNIYPFECSPQYQIATKGSTP